MKLHSTRIIFRIMERGIQIQKETSIFLWTDYFSVSRLSRFLLQEEILEQNPPFLGENIHSESISESFGISCNKLWQLISFGCSLIRNKIYWTDQEFTRKFLFWTGLWNPWESELKIWYFFLYFNNHLSKNEYIIQKKIGNSIKPLLF